MIHVPAVAMAEEEGLLFMNGPRCGGGRYLSWLLAAEKIPREAGSDYSGLMEAFAIRSEKNIKGNE